MTGYNYEYFQTLFKVNYTAGSSTATVSSDNLVPGTTEYESLTASNGATTLTSGSAGSTSEVNINSKTGVATTGKDPINVSFTYIGAVQDSSGNYLGILIESGGNYYLADVFENGTAQSKDLATGTSLTIDTSVGWNLAGTNYGATAYAEDGNPTPACFMTGTMIATPSGEVAVETLKAGDVVTLTDGRIAPVSWLGRQTVSTVSADPLRVSPIRIKANALADGIPSRDLLLSPDHALLVDGILAQAGALVNGVSIVRETEVPESFTYYHVEVADHALILAENTPAETFIDNVDRMAFDNWEEHVAAVGDTSIPEMEYPRAKAIRQVPQATRARLAARAEALFSTADAAAA